MSTDKNLRSLAKELKLPLTLIAREAELHKLEGISRNAQDAMALLDGYLLAARTEYGQISLPLETTGVGSVVYEVSQEIRPQAVRQNVIVSAMASSQTAVMAHRRGLKIALGCLAQLALAKRQEDEDGGKIELQVVSYEKRNGRTMAGILSNSIGIKPNDLKLAKMLYGDSHLAFSTQFQDSGIRLAIAQQLADAIGAKLGTFRRSGMNGIGLELMKSEQLRLV